MVFLSGNPNQNEEEPKRKRKRGQERIAYPTRRLSKAEESSGLGLR